MHKGVKKKKTQKEKMLSTSQHPHLFLVVESAYLSHGGSY